MGTLPAINLVADLAFRVIDQNLALARSTKTTKAVTEHNQNADDQRRQRMHGTGANQFKKSADGIGSPAAIPAKMMIEIPLPKPRSVICSPSHIRNIVPVSR